MGSKMRISHLWDSPSWGMREFPLASDLGFVETRQDYSPIVSEAGMDKRIRQVDAKARTTLFRDFAGATVAIERVSPEELRIRKIRTAKRKYTLAQLVSGITKKNRHAEINTGPPVGNEVW